MSDDVPDPPTRRRTRWPVVVAISALAIIGIAWLERRPVIRHFIDDTLARDQVPARYTLTDIGLGRQRLTDVVIGDPARPDLVADWIETEVGYGLSGPRLIGLSAGHVRVRGRLVDRRLSLGSIDRLLPPPSTKPVPFLLPAIALAVADGRLRLETPAGVVGMALSGSGRLDGGFSGRIAAVAQTLAGQGCQVAAPRMTGRVVALAPQHGASRVGLSGPLRWQEARCGALASGHGTAAIALTLSSPSIGGKIGVAVDDLRGAGASAATLVGSVTLTGAPAAPQGVLDLAASQVRGPQATAAAVTASGRYAVEAPAFDGTIGWRGLAVPPVDRLARSLAFPAGTPATPLVDAFARGLAGAARDSDGQASLHAARGRVVVDRLTGSSRTGARLGFAGSALVDRAGINGHGRAVLAGGGLPGLAVDIAATPAGAVTGIARLSGYAAGGAAMAPASVRVTRDERGWHAAGGISISGPLGSGRVEQLTLPIAASMDRGRITLWPGCAPVAAARLMLGGLTLDRSMATLCPTGAAVVSIRGGRVSAGARLSPLRLAGTLGGAPLTLAAAGGTIGGRDFTLDHVTATIGAADRQSRLALDRLDGTIAGNGVAGSFAGADGRIGAVPLALSKADGSWRFADGALALTGALTVADAVNPTSSCKPPFGADAPRFCPLEARDVRLTLANGRIDATGTLYAPGATTRVAAVTLRHDLAVGTGHAGFAVPGIVFSKDFQPERLTPASFGIVADVKGSVSGDAAIDWTAAGVTSRGRFTTAGLDLAAAFGPVTGVSGTIEFDDLLALATPPGQVLKVAGINPGVAVTDGVITYRLRPGSIVDVAGARWPFAGGTLTLEPTVLDLAHPVAKRLTFRVDGMQAAQFLQQFDFRNLDATGTFDGTLPMVFDEAGGRIENGELKVRQGGGTIAYVGDLTEKDLGFWGNLAFQALKSLRYRSLAIQMNGPLAGEMVTSVRFAGVQQGAGAKGNFLVRRLERLPFVFNITIRAPFRGLIDSAQSFYDPRLLVDRMLPVQPPASAAKP